MNINLTCNITDSVSVNRALMIYHLRVNPKNTRQVEGSLAVYRKKFDETGTEIGYEESGRCALGLAAQAFNICATWFEQEATGKEVAPYSELAKKLDIHEDHVREIYRLNDTYHRTFDEIADILEEYFKQLGPEVSVQATSESRRDGFTDNGPISVYREMLKTRDFPKRDNHPYM